MTHFERRMIGWVARHSAYTVVLSSIFVVAAASAGAYLWLARKAAAPLPPVGRQVAQLAFADGAVRIRRADSDEFIPADEGAELAAGDAVQTEGGARAVVRFGDGSNYRMEPGATLVLRDTGPTLGSTGTPLLREGRISPLAPAASPAAAPASDIHLATSSGDAASVRRRVTFGAASPRPDQPLSRK